MFELKNPELSETLAYKNDSINSPVSVVAYTYNILNWQFNVEKNIYTISDEEIGRIESYWKEKLIRFLPVGWQK
jgi:hypothetical protein